MSMREVRKLAQPLLAEIVDAVAQAYVAGIDSAADIVAELKGKKAGRSREGIERYLRKRVEIELKEIAQRREDAKVPY